MWWRSARHTMTLQLSSAVTDGLSALTPATSSSPIIVYVSQDQTSCEVRSIITLSVAGHDIHDLLLMV